jgi:cytochrome d ubiquinol oxidase subunit II
MLLVVLIVAFGAALSNRERIGADLSGRLWGLIFPGIGLLAIVGILVGVRQRRDGIPFAMTVAFFIASFLTLAVLFWPYMIPYQVTVADAAAPEKSLSFLFWGDESQTQTLQHRALCARRGHRGHLLASGHGRNRGGRR